MRVTDIRFEHHREPVGIGESRPRLTFRTDDQADPQQVHTGYEVEITGPDGAVDIHHVPGPDQVLVPWPGAALDSRDRRIVRVRLHGADNTEPGPWSEPFPVETGLLSPADWSAEVVSPESDDPDAPDPRPAALLRAEFNVTGQVTSARLYVTALGAHEMQVNGRRVGDHLLSPGWTSYRDRLRYHTFDVTDLLRDGRNAWGAQVADGWFRGRLGFNGGYRDIYGTRTGLLAQLEIRYSDGTVQTVTTGPDWLSAPGPITATSILDGEHYDARLERRGWSEPGHDTTGWSGVRILDLDPALLVAPDGPPVRITQEITPVDVITTPAGATIVDFGQNLVGWVRIRVTGPRGHTVTLRHAEVLEDGELGTRPLRFAAATDRYTLAGRADHEQWQPRFTFHGFRYVQVDDWPGDFDPAALVAVVVHTDMERTGWFSCSNPALNRLHENVVWGMRGNFLDVPTDCPQRDERLGWTGDLQVFAPTASYLYDCAGMLTSWLKDLWVDQRKDPQRVPPLISPNIPVNMGFPLPPENPALAGWGDATVIVPWVLYQRFGDLEVLRRQYDSMRGYLDAVAVIAGDNHLWEQDFQFGDWLDPAAPPDKPGEGRTPPTLVATAYLAHSAELLAQISGLLERPAEEGHYRKLADQVRAAFQRTYLLAPGRMTADSPAAYALALQFDLLPQEHRPAAGRRLAELTAAADYRVATGFLATPLIADALTDAGHLDDAYLLLLQRECPSWLYQVDMGATTIWERWDSMLPDGSINPGEMTSFNHYALGSVADWMHRTIGGLAPTSPGYRTLAIRPRPGGEISSARVAHRTPYGLASVDWRIQDQQLIVDSVVPAGASGTVELPGRDPVRVGPGQHRHQMSWPTHRTAEPAATA